MNQPLTNKGNRKFIRPTAEEDIEINAGVSADADTYAPTDAEFTRLHPHRGRPILSETEKKVRISMRIEPSVASYFKSTGKGWQTRMNAVLKDYISNH